MDVKDDPATDFKLSGFGMSDCCSWDTRCPARTGPPMERFRLRRQCWIGRAGHRGWAALGELRLRRKRRRRELQITFSIQRKYKGLLNRVRAKVASSFSTMMGNEQTEDRIIYRYERTTPHAPIIADYITLVLTDLPAGDWDLKVELLDRNTGRTTEKTSRVVIRD